MADRPKTPGEVLYVISRAPAETEEERQRKWVVLLSFSPEIAKQWELMAKGLLEWFSNQVGERAIDVSYEFGWKLQEHDYGLAFLELSSKYIGINYNLEELEKSKGSYGH